MSIGKLHNVKEILERLKQAFGINTDTELAKFLGVNQSTISLWKKRNTINYKLIITKCKKNEINLNWLLTGEGEMFLKKKEKGGIQFAHMTEEELLQIPGVMRVYPVPVINHQVPAGFPEMPLDRDMIVDWLYLPDIPKGAIAVKVKGTSMEPTIEDGDYVVFLPITKLNTPIKSGDVVIVRNEWRELVIKRYRTKDGKVYLTSDNPKYPTIEPNENYQIVGKVISCVREQRFV